MHLLVPQKWILCLILLAGILDGWCAPNHLTARQNCIYQEMQRLIIHPPPPLFFCTTWALIQKKSDPSTSNPNFWQCCWDPRGEGVGNHETYAAPQGLANTTCCSMLMDCFKALKCCVMLASSSCCCVLLGKGNAGNSPLKRLWQEGMERRTVLSGSADQLKPIGNGTRPLSVSLALSDSWRAQHELHTRLTTWHC